MQAEPAIPSHDFADGGDGPASTLAQLGDALPWPLMVLRADGQLLHANRAARQLLQEGGGLSLQHDRRLAVPPGHRRVEWEQALRKAQQQHSSSLLRWPDSAHGGSATLTPLGPGSGELLLALSAPAGTRTQAQVFAQLHGLSASETRVLLQLAQGETPAAAAAALGVSVATVRSQLLRLRRKSGQASLVELLRAVHRMPPVHTAAPGPGGLVNKSPKTRG